MRAVGSWRLLWLVGCAAGCAPWPTTPPADASVRVDTGGGADMGVQVDAPVADVADAGEQVDVGTTDGGTVDVPTGVDVPVGTDVLRVDAPMGTDVPVVLVDGGGGGVVTVREMGIVTVGAATVSTGTLQVRDMGFEYGERQCSTGASPICWIGGIVP